MNNGMATEMFIAASAMCDQIDRLLAVDWYVFCRGYQNNRRLNTRNPTNGERIENNSSRLTSRLVFAFRKEPALKHFPTIEKLDPGMYY
jgi:hypothetical protein